MAVDSDNRVYVLASTDRAKQLVDVYRGNELDFSFAAYRAPKIEATREATLSIPLAGLDIALHAAGSKQLAIYHYLQSPQRLGGVEVRGGPAKVRVAWRKSPERFVGAYRVYAAADKDGPYARLVETKESEASFDVDPAKPLTHYRVAAQSRLDVEGDPSAAVEDLFRAAYRLYEGGKLDAALEGFERATKGAPDHPPNIEYLGRTLLALGRNEAALAQFQDLARRPGLETLGRRLEARALAASGDVLGARAVVERAVAAGHTDGATYELCADLSLRLSDAAGAVRCADTALEREPQNAQARAMRGEALIAFARATKLDAKQGTGWAGLAEAYLALKDETKARDALTHAAALPDAPLAVYRQLADLETRAGRHAAAFSSLERAVALAPADFELRLLQARSAAALERWD